MKKKILEALVEGNIIRGIWTKFWFLVDQVLALIFRLIYSRFIKVKKNRIMFMTYDNDYSCNPKYIAEEIIRQKLPWELYWAVPAKGQVHSENFPPQIKLVKRGKYDGFMAMATSKIWVDNSLNFVWEQVRINKKPEQVYFETWHGSMGIKRVGKGDVKNKKWLRAASRMNKATDYCISNSVFEDGVFRETHWQDTPILRYGHARNDCFFNKELMDETKETVYDNLGIDPDTKVMLYAPTFRDNGNPIYNNLDYDAITKALSERFGGKWIVLIKLHFHDRNKTPVFKKYKKSVINVTGYTDIQELIMASDAGMTDYSSWAYDYILTRRPLFIFAPDISAYNTERGLYFPLESTPFPIGTKSSEVADNIRLFDREIYERRIDEFLEDKGSVEDGHAAERVVEKMKEIINGK